jgi:hypothetical protein
VADADAPLVPFDARAADERAELLGERAAREREREAALLLNGLALCVDDEGRERVAQLRRGWERVQDQRCARHVCAYVWMRRRWWEEGKIGWRA